MCDKRPAYDAGTGTRDHRGNSSYTDATLHWQLVSRPLHYTLYVTVMVALVVGDVMLLWVEVGWRLRLAELQPLESSRLTDL